MKILAFTDLHGSPESLKQLKKKAENADIIVCAGDFTIFETRIEKVLQELNKLGKQVLLINGNHEDELIVEKLCSKLPNIIFMHKKEHLHEYNKKYYTFIGFGGLGFSKIDKEFEKFTKKHLNKKNLILITHAPPYNTKLDLLWEHRGNKSITDFIKKGKPILAICGHFHENFGKTDKLGKTILLNPGPDGRIIRID